MRKPATNEPQGSNPASSNNPPVNQVQEFLAGLTVSFVVTLSVSLLGLDIQRVALAATFSSLGDLGAMFTQHMPTEWAPALILLGLPFALQHAMLAYLDTLLTSLVVDKKVDEMYGTGETTAQSHSSGAFPVHRPRSDRCSF